MSKRLENKIAVITGGNSGMGFETARRFINEGAKVVITGRRQAQLDEALAEIDNPNLIGIQGDVSNLSDLDRLYDEVKTKFGHLDILFANAGISNVMPLEYVTEEHFDTHFNINVKGMLFSVQKALPLMKDGGSIILNSSIMGSSGIPGFSVYSATKAAIRSFARTWTSELKARKIRVNTLSPGPIATPIFGKMGLNAEQQSEFASQLPAQIPLGRVGNPEEIASTVLFLASDESSFITGIELPVDGGLAQV
jgi:NAD(P)-dependent dehydrogenase (short-subunit alcohol dehydrogenase family)